MTIAVGMTLAREFRRRRNVLARNAPFGLACALCIVPAAIAGAPGVDVNVAGRLRIAATGAPITGPVNFRFTLHDLPIGGDPIATITVNGVTLDADGVFDTTVNFGAVDFSDNLYLQTEVDVSQTGDFSGTGDRRQLGGTLKTGFALVANDLQWPIAANVSSGAVAFAIFYDGTSQVLLGTNTNSSSTSPAVEGDTSGSGAGVKGKNTGTGAGVEGEVDNQQSMAPAIRGTSNGGGAAMELVNTGTGGAATISCTSSDYAVYVENNGTGKSLKCQDGMDVMGRTTMTHGQGFQRTLDVQNTSANGIALIAYNQNGGTGGYFSSIGGTGCTVDATGATSRALNCFTSLGQCASFETTGASNAQPTLTVNHAGTGACIEVNANGTGAAMIASGYIGIYESNPAHPIDHVSGAHLSSAGMFTNASSRHLKENFTPVDARAVLERVRQLPISRWNYRAEDRGVQHIGPIAEDFAAVFGLGECDESIGTVDADGVALAAIQGLGQMIDERDRQIAELSARLTALEATLRTVSRANASGTDR